MQSKYRKIGMWVLLAIVILLFGTVLIRTAWVSDDAYITFRTVDNFIHGYGLTWNTDERVQAYTHPLWMFLLSAVYFFTHEIFISSMIVSIIISLATVVFFSWKIPVSPSHAIIGVLILTFSKAFVDYSTSGLENPLTHLILVAFLYVYLKFELSARKLFSLSLLAALGTLNRMDTILIFLPPLVHQVVALKDWRKLWVVGLGFLPFLAWEAFSLFYYGFLFPNTAYAKLNTGVSAIVLAEQGIKYFVHSIQFDPITLISILLAVAIAFFIKRESSAPVVPVAGGILLYLLYIIKVGGDFMSGRLLSAVVVVAVCLIAVALPRRFQAYHFIPCILIIALIGFSSPYPTVFSNLNYGTNRPLFGNTVNEIVGYGNVTDERGYYYQTAGLLTATQDEPTHLWAEEGKKLHSSGTKLAIHKNVGFLGYYAGPEVHIVDHHALTDPLLARLYVSSNSKQLIYPGHFYREIPEGYIETLQSGENKIMDHDLAEYYDKIALITKGDLFDPKRLLAILRLTIGTYDHIVTSYNNKT